MVYLTLSERRLFRAIVAQAVKDYVHRPDNVRDDQLRGEAQAAQSDAADFLTAPARSADLKMFCALSDLAYYDVVSTIARDTPEKIRERMIHELRLQSLGG